MMGVILYRLTLTTPALFPLGIGDPNNPDSAKYIPGGTVLGALAHRWLQNHSTIQSASTNPEFRRLFLDGSVCYLHAYPATNSDQRMLPTPRSLYEEKGEGEDSTLHDLVADTENDLLQDPNRDYRVADKLGFISWDGSDSLTFRSPRTCDYLHQVRDRKQGKPTDGGIFSYQAISEGEVFIGAILTQTPEDERTLKELLEAGLLMVGRSKSARYGGAATVALLRADANWAEVKPSIEEPEHLVVTLLSDYLPRPMVDEPLIDAFEKELALQLRISKDELIFVSRYTATRMVRGYVAHWRLPRPTVTALAAGSVFVYDQPANFTLPAPFSIGDRQVDGYGRVAVNWHGGYSEKILRTKIKQIHTSYRVGKTEKNSLPLDTFNRRLLAQWFKERVIQRVQDMHPDPPAGFFLSPSAASSIRTAIASLSNGLVPQEFHVWAEQAVGKRVLQSLQRCHLVFPHVDGGNDSLAGHLKSLTGEGRGQRAIEILRGGDGVPEYFKDFVPSFSAIEPLVAERLATSLTDALLERVRRLAKERR